MPDKQSIFISYPWDYGSGQKFALWLYTFLVEKYNTTVYFDRFSTQPGSNLKKFMSNATTSKYILCICNDYYLERMNVNGSGVKFEVDKLDSNNSTIIPLVEKDKEMPQPFTNLKYIKVNMDDPADLKNVNSYYDLLNLIFPDKPNHISTKYERQIKRLKKITKIRHSMAFNPDSRGELSFSLKINDGKTEVGEGKQKFKIKWTSCGVNEVYIYNDFIGSYLYISKQKNAFDSIKMPSDLENEFSSYERVNPIGVGHCFAFINDYDFTLVGQILSIHGSEIKFKYKILQR